MHVKTPAWERRAARTAKAIAELKAKRSKIATPLARSPFQYVYFARSQEFVKIGWTASMETRLNNLQLNNPHEIELLATMIGGANEEVMLHSYFRADHHRGEWFRLGAAIQSLVDEIGHLEPLEARVRAGEWFLNRVGTYGLTMPRRNIEALRKVESRVANVRGNAVALPEAEKVL